MKVNIKYCNNIIEGTVNIEENKLNIKYGVNGTGKSTISKAIKYKILSQNELENLRPYNYVDNENILPEVSFDKQPESVMIYNNEYIKNILFLSSDEIMENSFEIFIAPKNYKEQCKDIDNELLEINKMLDGSEVLNQLNAFHNRISVLMTGAKQSKKSYTLGKSKIKALFDNGNKFDNIPENIKGFELYLNSSNNIKWIDWHSKNPSMMNNVCPYCSQQMNEYIIKAISDLDGLFNKSSLETYTAIKDIFTNSSELFLHETIQNINEAISSNTMKSEDKDMLVNIYFEVKHLIEKLSYVDRINAEKLIKSEQIETDVLNKKIDLSSLNWIKGTNLINELNEYNSKIDSVAEKISTLKEKIGKLNYSLRKTTEENLFNINEFLEISGIDYKVKLSQDRKKVFLTPLKHDIQVNVREHLSYGEINSFALALFTFQVKNLENALIILDDPISSYDSHKKYAMLHYLFTGKKHLRYKTVLLLTHDLEPIIDIYKVKHKNCIPEFVSAKFLENNKGYISEKDISSNDIKPIVTLIKDLYSNTNLNVINRLIHYRRYLELCEIDSIQYNVISSLFKVKPNPTYKDGSPIDKTKIEEAYHMIKGSFSEFDYDKIRDDLSNITKMITLYNTSSNNYEKIEIFRMIKTNFDMINIADEIIKFIDETFHIENSYLFQLNPYNFDSVPNYIISICDREIAKLVVN